MPNILLWFDTEDYITSESDEALLGLLRLLRSRNIRGIFKIVGEKARVLHTRKRQDILSELQHHEIGFHTDLHSVHPTVSEYLETYSFRDGAEEFERREGNGLADLHRITGMQSLTYGQAGYSWAPQVFPTLKHWGIHVYLDVHDQVAFFKKPFWYGGLLNLTDLSGLMRMELREGGLEKAIRQFDTLLGRPDSDGDFISIYYHPCEFATTEFWDGVNFSNGAHTPRVNWKPAALQPPGRMEHHLRQLEKFIDYTLSKENVRYLTTSEAYMLERSSEAPLTSSDIRKVAEQIGHSLCFTVLQEHSLSAADIFRCLYRELLNREFPADTLYGPENFVKSEFTAETTVAEIKQAIAVEFPSVYEFRQLPDSFRIGGKRVNPVDMACTMAYIVANRLSDEDRVQIIEGELASEKYVKDNPNWGNRWVIFPRNLQVPNLVQLSKLQAWTLKPALFY